MIALAIGIIYAFYIGFLAYAAVMNHGWGNLPLWHKILILPAGLAFGVLDVILNHTVACVLFWSLPIVNGKWCPTISIRCEHLIALAPEAGGWRTGLAMGIVGKLLLPFTKDY